MELVHAIIWIIWFVGAGFVWVCLALAALALLFNLCLPYAMLKLPPGKGTSCFVFPLFEWVPLLLAALVSWLIDLGGIATASHILIYGGGAMIISYFQFFVVAMIVGVSRWWKNTGHKTDAPGAPESSDF